MRSAILAAALIPALASAQIQVGATSQVSLSTSSVTPQGGASSLPSFGPNGRFLVFESDAFDIVDFDTNGNTDVFVRDLKLNTYALGSVNSIGVQAAGQSNHVTVSQVFPDGFYAYAFESDAQNLTTIPNLSVFRNIYLRIPSLAITEIVSPGVGFTAPFGDSTFPSIAAVQQSKGIKVFVAFSSSASNLVDGDSNAFQDIFLSEVPVPSTSTYTPSSFSTTIRIPTSFVSGSEPNGTSTNPKVSGDGRYVVFESDATNLVSGINGGSTTRHIYLYDIFNAQTTLISKAADGTPGDDNSSDPVISFNGRYVAYTTSATNIISVPGGSSLGGVIRYDTKTGAIEQANTSSSGAQGNGQASNVAMSANGRLLSFSDNSSNLISSGDFNDFADIYVKDMDNGTISLVSVGPGGIEASGESTGPALASTSFNSLTSSVAFMSSADNLTPSQTASGNGDVYLNSVTLPAPSLSSGLSLDVPPDVTVKSKKITFAAQKFSAATLSSASNLQVRYEFRVTVTTTSNGKTRKTKDTIIQKKNLLTIVKSKGKITVKNRVLGINASTGKTVVKTGFTPRQTFTVS